MSDTDSFQGYSSGEELDEEVGDLDEEAVDLIEGKINRDDAMSCRALLLPPSLGTLRLAGFLLLFI